MRRQPEGMGVRKSATGNACGGNPDCHRIKAPLLSDVQGRTAIAASLPMHLPLPPLVLGKAPARAGSLTPQLLAFPRASSPPGPSLLHPQPGNRKGPRWVCHAHDYHAHDCWLPKVPSHCWGRLSHMCGQAVGRAPARANSCAHGLWLSCAPVATVPPASLVTVPPLCLLHTGADLCAPGQPQEQTRVGGPHAEVGLKPQLSPWGRATKEVKLKSLFAAVQTVN